MLEVLAAEHGPLISQAIAERLGLDPTGSTFRTYLGHLRANGLVRKTTGGFVVADELRL
jgi:DNA-binding IclR family transcriptional regulator